MCCRYVTPHRRDVTHAHAHARTHTHAHTCTHRERERWVRDPVLTSLAGNKHDYTRTSLSHKSCHNHLQQPCAHRKPGRLEAHVVSLFQHCWLGKSFSPQRSARSWAWGCSVGGFALLQAPAHHCGVVEWRPHWAKAAEVSSRIAVR
jgi:hypothetical protein